MQKLVIHPTSTAQWQSLVHEASLARSITISENIESYLVFLLMRFTQHTNIASETMADKLLNALQSSGRLQNNSLQEVGDQCLLFSGLFPEIARRRRVRISYFVDMGRSAYDTISDLHALPTLAMLYKELGQEFITMVDILHCMRELSNNIPALDPLQAMEVWEDLHLDSAIKALNPKTDENKIILTKCSNQTKH